MDCSSSLSVFSTPPAPCGRQLFPHPAGTWRPALRGCSRDELAPLLTANISPFQQLMDRGASGDREPTSKSLVKSTLLFSELRWNLSFHESLTVTSTAAGTSRTCSPAAVVTGPARGSLGATSLVLAGRGDALYQFRGRDSACPVTEQRDTVSLCEPGGQHTP